MFEQSFLNNGTTVKAGSMTVVALMMQLFVVTLLIVISIISPTVIRQVSANSVLFAPTPTPPRATSPETQTRSTTPSRKTEAKVFTAPTKVSPNLPPTTATQIDLAPPPAMSGPAGIPGATPCGPSTGLPCDTNLLFTSHAAAPPPPPPAPKKVAEDRPLTQRIAVGGKVQEANLLRRVLPVYPSLAKQAGIQGTVVLTAVISKDGRIEKLSLVSGHPMLVAAAMEAVQQWTYHPTTLNGAPVEVVTQIEVNFKLNR